MQAPVGTLDGRAWTGGFLGMTDSSSNLVGIAVGSVVDGIKRIAKTR